MSHAILLQHDYDSTAHLIVGDTLPFLLPVSTKLCTNFSGKSTKNAHHITPTHTRKPFKTKGITILYNNNNKKRYNTSCPVSVLGFSDTGVASKVTTTLFKGHNVNVELLQIWTVHCKPIPFLVTVKFSLMCSC